MGTTVVVEVRVIEDSDTSGVPLDATTIVKQVRQDLGLTQKQFAALLNVSFSSVNRWENGKSRPSLIAWYWVQLIRAEGAEAYKRRAGYPSRTSLEDGSVAVLFPDVLVPGVLPGLWATEVISVRTLFQYFSGSHAVTLGELGKTITIPQVEQAVVEAAVRDAVRNRLLWFTFGSASFCGDDIAQNLFVEDAQLREPPERLSAVDILPSKLPQVWTTDTTTALAISVALSDKAGRPLPWPVVRSAIDADLSAGLLVLAPDSGLWPCTAEHAGSICLRVANDE